MNGRGEGFSKERSRCIRQPLCGGCVYKVIVFFFFFGYLAASFLASWIFQLEFQAHLVATACLEALCLRSGSKFGPTNRYSRFRINYVITSYVPELIYAKVPFQPRLPTCCASCQSLARGRPGGHKQVLTFKTGARGTKEPSHHLESRAGYLLAAFTTPQPGYPKPSAQRAEIS